MQRLHQITLSFAISLFLANNVFAENNHNRFRFRAIADGAQEVTAPAPDNGVVTDTAGSLRLRFNAALSEANFVLRVRHGVAITQAHLHCAGAGENGPIIVFLFGLVNPGVDVNGTLSRGTFTNEDILFAANDGCIGSIGRPINNIASLASAVLEGLIYVNVHSEENPGGEVRGQILND